MAKPTVLHPNALDLTGQVFGRLTALAPTSRRSGGSVVWRCRCSCGREAMIGSTTLKSHTRSCGCWQREQAQKQMRTHGQSRTPEFDVWHSMWQRCRNHRARRWHHYGGRGITVCERWQTFESFLADMGPRPSPELSLHRIDNNRGYEPGNCVWATLKEQARKKQNNRLLTLNGHTMCLAEWAEHLAVKRNTIYRRLKRGWSVEQALTISTTRSKAKIIK